VFDWWVLLGIFYALYGVECVAWIDGAAWVCFTVPVRGRWRCSRGSELPGNERGGFLLANPLSSSPAVVVCGLWPISISPAGVSNVSAGERSTPEAPAYVTFTDVRSVRADLNGLYVNGQLFARASLPLSGALSGLIESCRTADLNQREIQIREALAAAADGRRAQTRWTECLQQARGVQKSAAFLLWYTLAFAPAVIAFVGPYPTWPWLLAGLAIGTGVTATQYFRAHATLYPAMRFERWVQATAMILLPVGAMRAAVNLSRPVLEPFSPFAVLPSVCGANGAARQLRVAWWDLQLPPGRDNVAAEWAGCVEWCRAATVSAAIEAIRAAKVDLHSAPDKEDEGSVSYCPRCHAQFRSGGVMCHVCDAVEVVPFPPRQATEPAANFFAS
jgi:hypothetical protein